MGFPTLLRGNAKRWFIHSDIDKTNLKRITDAFKTRFLNPSKCSTATLFQQKQRVGENVQDYITSMRATAARLGTPDRQVLEAIMNGFLPEIREKVIMRDPRTLEDLESAAVLSETARSNPAFRSDSSTTCTAGKSDLQTLVQAMSELIKTQIILFRPFRVKGDEILIKITFKILQFLLKIQNLYDGIKIIKNKTHSILQNLMQIINVTHAINPVTSDQHVDTGMLSVIGVDKKFIHSMYFKEKLFTTFFIIEVFAI